MSKAKFRIPTKHLLIAAMFLIGSIGNAEIIQDKNENLKLEGRQEKQTQGTTQESIPKMSQSRLLQTFAWPPFLNNSNGFNLQNQNGFLNIPSTNSGSGISIATINTSSPSAPLASPYTPVKSPYYSLPFIGSTQPQSASKPASSQKTSNTIATTILKSVSAPTNLQTQNKVLDQTTQILKNTLNTNNNIQNKQNQLNAANPTTVNNLNNPQNQNSTPSANSVPVNDANKKQSPAFLPDFISFDLPTDVEQKQEQLQTLTQVKQMTVLPDTVIFNGSSNQTNATKTDPPPQKMSLPDIVIPSLGPVPVPTPKPVAPQQSVPDATLTQLILPPKVPPPIIPPLPSFAPSYTYRQQGQRIQLLNKKVEEIISGVVVTFRNINPYDQLFTQVQQKSKEGTTVLVYSSTSGILKNISAAFKGDFQNSDKTVRELITYVQRVGKDCPACIIFNWECSSGYSGQKFTEGRTLVMEFLQYILGKGYIAMFSDFSLKALIAEWDSNILGPNPFVKVSQTSTPINLRFDPLKLKQSPSAQLQMIGQLVDGNLQVNVLGGTIVYSVDTNVKTDSYKLDVLTVASNFKSDKPNLMLKYDRYQGTAGHVLLTYPNGGHILTSMGHWIELMKVDTSAKKLFEVAQQKYGDTYAQNLQNTYNNLGDAQKGAFVTMSAMNFIQNQSPGQNAAYIKDKIPAAIPVTKPIS